MAKAKNILFIMFDQLRFDYLGCTGHPHLQTPHIDRLAEQSVRFSRCYVQSPVCGASRMSFYTGRYVSSHGAAWNNIPLKVGEVTVGDHLRDRGMDAVLVGKTHMKVDAKGMARLGLAPDSVIGARVSECGFDVFTRDDGLWASGPDGKYDNRPSPYNDYLKEQGYDGDNPWHDYANAGVDEDGNIASGWLYKNAARPANIREQDSETPWLTREAIRFMESRKAAGGTPWMCHLSYIKPHWPYIVPAPYHDMYGPSDFLPVVRHEDELNDPNPVYAAFAGNAIGQAFRRDDVRDASLAAYMGLIKQIDDQMGVLFRYLEDTGQMDNTVIVITSDHGDYMGDHWLGEKDLFHDASVKVPLIIHDPSPEADATRGTVVDELVEAIDLAATFTDLAAGDVPDEMIEGRSLLPFLHGEPPAQWRDYAISEYDYSMSGMATALDVSPDDARLFMVTTRAWKFMHAEGGFPPMLFDLARDPDELNDLGRHPDYQAVVAECYDRLFHWARRPAQRTTLPKAELVARRGKSSRAGVLLGVADDAEINPELMVKYSGPARQIHTPPKGPLSSD
ncbi:MAG: sulfatase-like hydrolase/transferase [Alphaproteobacteria bacterium]|nr:sulfatase-like hydrolase/transferase [Alphaproteobacteria bacterium]